MRHIERVLSLWGRVENPDLLANGDCIDQIMHGSQIAEWAGDARRAMLLGERARLAVDERVEPLRAAAAELRIGRALWNTQIARGGLQLNRRVRPCDQNGRRGLRIALDFELRYEVMRGYVNTSQAMDDSGRLPEALQLGADRIEAAQRLGLNRRSGDQQRVQAAWRLARMGHFSEAGRVVEPAREAATMPLNFAATKAISGHLAAERGGFETAERLLDEAWQLMQRSGGFPFTLARPAGQGRQHVSDGLLRITAKEPDLIYNGELYWLAARVHAELASSAKSIEDARIQAREALTALDAAIASYRGEGAPPEALAFRELARAEFRRLNNEPSPTAWRKAGDRFRALDERYRAAYADFRTAEALALSGAPDTEIAKPLRTAHAMAVEAGVQPFSTAA